MSRHAFFIAGERIIHIANAAGAGFQYQAKAHTLAPQAQVGPHRHEHAETAIYVQDGIVDIMVNGLAASVAAGSFVRIPPKTWYACRNAGAGPAHLLCRTSPVPAVRDSLRVTIELTAA